MPSHPSNTPPARRPFAPLLAAILTLAIVLGFIFSPSFESSKILFANDAPLGSIKSACAAASSTITGYWTDLVWIGYANPGSSPSISFFNLWMIGPLNHAKFYAPIGLFVLGLSAWFFCRQSRFHPAVGVLVALAAALNSNSFSNACWGLANWPIAWGMTFLAIAGIISPASRPKWFKLALAGMAVGLGVMEGFDVGAFFSLFVGVFCIFHESFRHGRPTPRQVGMGLISAAVLAIFAFFIAYQTVGGLIDTQIKGVAGTGQDQQTKEQRWDFATQWSMPKKEVLRLAIPGLFGYRMDTTDGGQYWGTTGQQPGWEQHHQGFPRYIGNGEYAGLLVLLVAAWAVAQSLRGKQSPFDIRQKRMIWFWSGAALLSLLLAFGRYASFYQLFYALPYASTIRNPIKFLHPLHISLLILFAHGLQDLVVRYMEKTGHQNENLPDRLSKWWNDLKGFDQLWVRGVLGLWAVAVIGWLVYASKRRELLDYLASSGFDPKTAELTAGFSMKEYGSFMFFLVLASGVMMLILTGWFSGVRKKFILIIFGVLLVADFSRADSPWIVYQDYQKKYASNPIIDFVRDNSLKGRVGARVAPLSQAHLANDQAPYFATLYSEWMQQQFRYYDIPCIDIPQMPRVPELDAAFMGNFQATNNETIWHYSRLWQLTSTRYIIGMTGYLNLLNTQFDPGHQRFQIATNFNVAPKPGVTNPQNVEDLTAVPDPKGGFALFEFTGALPRVSLYANWQVITNDDEALKQLGTISFDPQKTVLVSDPISPSTNAPGTKAGTVEYAKYSPKDILLKAHAETPAVLLLTDHYHPDWKVTIDGQPAALLRCNHITRGVLLPPGDHTVEFQYLPSVRSLYVTLAAEGAGLLLCLAMALPIWPAQKEEAPAAPTSAPASIPASASVAASEKKKKK